MSDSLESIDNPGESGRAHLEQQLRELDQQIRHELRVRGFDPDQEENLALTAPLARLFAERERLRDELKSPASE